VDDGYKDPIRNYTDARWNLCRELDETGARIGTPPSVAILWYLLASAWWSDRYKRRMCGEVKAEHGSPLAIMRWTGIAKSTVYDALLRLEQSGWIDVSEVEPGKHRVVVLLDDRARRAREVIRKASRIPGAGMLVREPESDSGSRNASPGAGMATVTDLRKRASRN
jgi:hypothetical protein